MSTGAVLNQVVRTSNLVICQLAAIIQNIMELLRQSTIWKLHVLDSNTGIHLCVIIDEIFVKNEILIKNQTLSKIKSLKIQNIKISKNFINITCKI